MLLNNTERQLTLKWDGREAKIAAGEKFNVGQYFDIKMSEISGLEARFMQKNPGLVRISNELGEVTARPAAPAPAIPEIEKAPALTGEAAESTDTDEAEQPINENAPRSLADHNKAELQTMAKQLNIPFTDKTNKADLVKSIEKALAATED